MHEVPVNRIGGLSLPRKSVVRLTDRPDMTLDVYRGRKTTKQQQQQHPISNGSNHVSDNISNVQNSSSSMSDRRFICNAAIHCIINKSNDEDKSSSHLSTYTFKTHYSRCQIFSRFNQNGILAYCNIGVHVIPWLKLVKKI